MILLDPAIKEGYDSINTRNADEAKQKYYFEYHLGMKEEAWAKAGLRAPGKEGQRITGVAARDVGQTSVHRAHFLDVLIKMVPDGVAKFGKKVENVQNKGEKMVMTFADGTEAEADAVIGCDGVKSVTRKVLLGKGHKNLDPTFSHKYAYRGLIPMEKAAEVLGDALARNAQMYFGHHGHVLTFPIEKGKTMNVVAFQSKEGEWEDERWVLPMKKEDMFNDFAGWGDSVQRILSVSLKLFSFRQVTLLTLLAYGKT